MYNTILVPLDGTKAAEAIIPHAQNLAQRQPARVVFTRVVEPVSRSLVFDPDAPPKYEFDPKAGQKAQDYLAVWQEKFQQEDIEAETLILYGLPVDGLVHAARETEADLIAMASEGRTGLSQAFRSSVAAEVLHRMHGPMLITHPDIEGGTETNHRILVPLDRSKRAEAILPHVAQVARLYESQITLFHVVTTTYQLTVFDDLDQEMDDQEVHGHLLEKLEHKQEVERVKKSRQYLMDMQSQLRDKGLDVNIMMAHGRVIEGVIHAAQSIEADLIAMTSHGTTGLARVFYGSVTAGVLNRALFPLLVVRPEL